MKIKVGVGSLRNYQRMPYTFHGALGEFVDNSIQAYFDERKQLDKLFKKEKGQGKTRPSKSDGGSGSIYAALDLKGPGS